MDSLYFRLTLIGQGKFTAMQREMLTMTLAANPGVTLGVAVTDVFEYLKIKLKKGQLEAICNRLIAENEERTGTVPDDKKAEISPVRQQKKSTFGASMLKWVNEMQSADRLLTATGFDHERTRKIYCEEDFLVTDTINKLFLQKTWEDSLVQMEAAAAPWVGGKSGPGSNGGTVETYDMSKAGDDDPQWKEMAACFGG